MNREERRKSGFRCVGEFALSAAIQVDRKDIYESPCQHADEYIKGGALQVAILVANNWCKCIHCVSSVNELMKLAMEDAEENEKD